ncbi:PAS and ANTAR domain-containing protein [Modestobacter marinus]|uniref:PAS and ANTAR domain-containing protein n=1 Tax=Modestobacter marinus TaxID=477641 RepID=UPI001C967844|nr:PAS and ANTAR domain-containing protein [Modestobacter marinus]
MTVTVTTPTSAGSSRPTSRSRPPRTAPQATPPRPGHWRGDLLTGEWWWSPEVVDLLGLHSRTSTPSVQLLLSHVHPEDRPALRNDLGLACATGTPFTREFRLLRADGRQRGVILVCEPAVEGNGTVVALSGLAIDVTDQVRPGAARGRDEQVRHLETEIEQLRTAMASRAAIEQAKGILMLLMSCGDQVAFELLAHISSHTHRKVREVAVSIIDSATGRGALPADVRAILHDACPPRSAIG